MQVVLLVGTPTTSLTVRYLARKRVVWPTKRLRHLTVLVRQLQAAQLLLHLLQGQAVLWPFTHCLGRLLWGWSAAVVHGSRQIGLAHLPVKLGCSAGAVGCGQGSHGWCSGMWMDKAVMAGAVALPELRLGAVDPAPGSCTPQGEKRPHW